MKKKLKKVVAWIVFVGIILAILEVIGWITSIGLLYLVLFMLVAQCFLWAIDTIFYR